MQTSEMIECPNCGCTDFSLEWAGPHIKATCKSCKERFKATQGNSTYMFVSLDKGEQELATPKQVLYVKSLVKEKADKLSKQLACDIIATLKA